MPPRAATTRSCSWASSSRSTGAWRSARAFSLDLLEARPGFLLFRARGERARRAFEGEAGGHRWQRVPPTDKRGRVHTSTVTVAVLPEPEEAELRLSPGDLEWKTTRGSGPGGQHRNKVETAVVLRHLPSGTTVRCESGKSQKRNKELALRILRARLRARSQQRLARGRNRRRRDQLGSGMRGDKIRTVALQRDRVTDHRTGRKTSARRYLRGDLTGLRSEMDEA